MANAQLQNVNGSPAIVVDGKVYPPMTITIGRCGNNEDYLRKIGEAGLRIFYLSCSSEWICRGEVPPEISPSVKTFGEHADYLLKAVPDAKIMVRIYVAPPPKWCDEHPDDVVRYQDGSTRKVIPGGGCYNAMYNMSSAIWQEEAELTLNNAMEKLDKLPCADHIIGYFLSSAGTGEWYNCCPMSNEGKGIYADCSP